METEITPIEGLPEKGATTENPQAEHPGFGMRLLYFMLLMFMYMGMQIVVGIPFLVVAAIIYMNQTPTIDMTMLAESPFSVLYMIAESRPALWATVLAAATAAALAIGAALLWPKIISRGRFTGGHWAAWRNPRHIKVWMTIAATIVMLLAVGIGVASFFEETEVALQMMLFSTPGLGLFSAIVVTTVVPAAEELLFRGALYNLMLPGSDDAPLSLKAHILPFTVVTLSFGLIHLLAGFEHIGSIVQVILLSAFLTTLRTVSGSVKPSMLAHALWNGAAAFGMLATTYLPF